MQLERDVRAITAFLTSKTDAAIRDKFTRLSQICTVLAVEEVPLVKFGCLSCRQPVV